MFIKHKKKCAEMLCGFVNFAALYSHFEIYSKTVHNNLNTMSIKTIGRKKKVSKCC